ncbi:hypothetical protein O1611_g7916 [Lasiodiplodia mahajangana]|uniref:Uncharacterized protein n=1 Tax=Lasiodiplodia mahajangana TaxID=1108764 RepID=A0ACC2JDW9_9PEZI|nr:hypothetical protein O1611_g7916 [Lasiodiplodia mahajangana]
MGMLISDPGITDRLMEDYKETLYGFAVIKSRGIACYKSCAEANNLERRLLAVAKQVAYDSSFHRVTRETIGLHFNEGFYDKGFKRAIRLAVQKACKAFHGIDHVSVNGFQVDVCSRRASPNPSTTFGAAPRRHRRRAPEVFLLKPDRHVYILRTL